LKLEQIQLVHFRNHTTLTFGPYEGINLLYGPNGSGKTSILEGIHYCALSKGFINTYDSECLGRDKSFFLLKGTFSSDCKRITEVKVIYDRQRGKELTVNEQSIAVFSTHIGCIPCITFSPADISIVSGSPAERRRFLDNAICQTDPVYLAALLKYRRILQQRNSLLSIMKENRRHCETIDILSEQMVEQAAAVVAARMRFIRELNPGIVEYHGLLSYGEEPFMTYRCSFPADETCSSQDRLAVSFREWLKEKRHEEISRGLTLAGPHRDEVLFFLNGKDLKRYASQGQKRSFLIALKLSLHGYFRKKIDEQPICLFDDLFSELDAKRIDALISMLEPFGQTIITTTENRFGTAVSSVDILELTT